MKEKINTFKKLIPYILIIFGGIIVIYALYQRASTIYHQNYFLKEYDKYLSELKQQNNLQQHITDEKDKNIVEIKIPDTLINPNEVIKNKVRDIKEEPEIIGVLVIPKININVAILEGIDTRALKYTVGFYPQTAKPGENGNSVLLGHRNGINGRVFYELDKLEKGDCIIVKRDTNTYTYSITESFVVEPQDTWVLNQTSDAQITMITCTPIGTYTHRLIVKGVLIEAK